MNLSSVFAIPMRTRFRGITVREGVLLRGEAGWGEWSPFTEYPPEVAEPWLRCAEEAAAFIAKWKIRPSILGRLIWAWQRRR